VFCYNPRDRVQYDSQKLRKTMHLTKLFSRREEEEIEKEFHVSIYILVYKFVLGTIEFAAGMTIALFGAKIYHLYQASLIKELSEDPHDLLARLSEGIVPNLFAHHTYLVIYLITLGAAKMAGAIGLAFKKNWGVDLLVGLTILMAPFQIVNLILHWNFFDFLYLVLGLLIALYLVEFKPKAWVSRIFLRSG
jgi:uncharacterized membrane protein